MGATLIINACVVNEGRSVEADVRLRDGRITQVGQGLTCYGDEELVDAAGRHLLPGVIDERGLPADAAAVLVAGGVTSSLGLTADAAHGLLNHVDVAHVPDVASADAVCEAGLIPARLEAVFDGAETLEGLVERLIHAPARRLRLEGRGFVCEDGWADLVLVDLEQPGVGSDGVHYRASVVMTWVNGEKVWDGNQLLDARPGRLLQFAD